jgi:hypothetical protein
MPSMPPVQASHMPPNMNSRPQSEYLQAAKYQEGLKGHPVPEKFQVSSGVRDDTYCTKAAGPCPPGPLCEHLICPQTLNRGRSQNICRPQKISRGAEGAPYTRKYSKSGSGCATTPIAPRRHGHALHTPCASITHTPKHEFEAAVRMFGSRNIST